MLPSIGPYNLDQELGRGAMGIVFRGFDPSIGRTVAVKVVHIQDHSSAEDCAEARLRFRRDASAAGRLSHPNIVTIYQLGEERGVEYIVMEFVPGATMTGMIQASAPMAADQAIKLLFPIADALDHAHREGIVHRDIKPSNIMVRPDGTVKITDFGIARIVSQRITRTGSALGTPAYMPPSRSRACPLMERRTSSRLP